MENDNTAPAAKSEARRARFAPDPSSPLTKGQQKAEAKQAKAHPQLFDVDAAEFTLPLFRSTTP